MTKLEQELLNALKQLSSEQNKRFQELENELETYQKTLNGLVQHMGNLTTHCDNLTTVLNSLKKGR